MTPEQIEMYKNMDAGSRVVFPDDPQTVVYPFLDIGRNRTVLTQGLKIKLTDHYYYILGSEDHPLNIKYSADDPVEIQTTYKDMLQELDNWLKIPGVVKGVIEL